MASCYHCSDTFSPDLYVVRTTECARCRKDVRVCRNCLHYSPGSHWDCRESVSDPVVDKERANFCDWFKLSSSTLSGPTKDHLKAQKARSGFEALFGSDVDQEKD